MKEELQKRCDLFLDNREQISKVTMLQDNEITTVAAYAYSDKEKTADIARLKECIKLIDKRQGIFSEFRGSEELVVATKMDMSGDPEKYIDDAIRVYKQITKGKIFGSSSMLLAAMSICDVGKADEAEELLEKSNALIKSMSKKHPFVVSESAIGFAALMTLMKEDTQALLEEIEASYKTLKKVFYDDAAYELAQILTVFEGSREQKCGKVLELFQAFKDQGIKYGKSHEAAVLGTMVNIQMPVESLVGDIIDVADYLKGKKGFKMFDISREKLLMIAAMIVSGLYTKDDTNKNDAIIGGTVAMVVAEQVMMCVVIMSATAAVISASSH